MAGFLWMFSASLLVVSGGVLGLVGIAGGILVRARPDTGNVINYDPSRVALLAPIPFGIGVLMVFIFAGKARKRSH